MTTTSNMGEGRLAIIGGGKMGEAIAAGLLASGLVPREGLAIAEPLAARREELETTHDVAVFADGMDALEGASLVILAVKPQNIDQVVSGLAAGLSGTVVVSIAAGVSCARLESLLPEGTAVVRVMPNTPAMVREGMALVSGGRAASDEQVTMVAAVFGALGRAVVIDERFQDAGTAISGSGPAYFSLVVDALARAGVMQGLPREVAQDLAVQTMRGTAGLLQQTGIHPEQLIDSVSSPGGTTIAAVNALEAGGVRAAFADAVSAATARAKELGAGR